VPTGITYLDEAWNTVYGCTPISPGCANCYAAEVTFGLARKGQTNKAGLSNGRDFNGVVRCLEDRLTMPLHWKRPRVIGVNFMGDTFHESVPSRFILKLFAVMSLCPQHQFMMLTKRAGEMAGWFAQYGSDEVYRQVSRWLDHEDGDPLGEGKIWDAAHNLAGVLPWPLPNVLLGVTVEDQQRADERIPWLLKCPGRKWLSVEPMLEPINLRTGVYASVCGGERGTSLDGLAMGDGISLVIVGCESIQRRPGRPMSLDWARSLRDQCKAAGVAYYVKQLEVDGKVTDHMPDFPADLRIREFPKGGRK